MLVQHDVDKTIRSAIDKVRFVRKSDIFFVGTDRCGKKEPFMPCGIATGRPLLFGGKRWYRSSAGSQMQNETKIGSRGYKK